MHIAFLGYSFVKRQNSTYVTTYFRMLGGAHVMWVPFCLN